MTQDSATVEQSFPGLDRVARRIFDLPYADLTPRLALGVQKALAAEHSMELLQALKRESLWRAGHSREAAEHFGEAYLREFLINGANGVTRMLVNSSNAAISKAEGRIL